MSFSGINFTTKGKVLQAKALTGVQLTFTRIAMGDGSITTQDTATLTALIDQVKSLPITSLKAMSGGKAKVGSVFSNTGLTTGFYWREIGLFATDPDEGEILYCYGNAGNLAEYIPSEGSNAVEKNVNIVAIVGSDSSVTATIDSSLVYELKKDHDSDMAAVNSTLSSHTKSISDLNYQTAGGTATAITLTINQTLTDGYPVNFIASADNGGGSTTINNIPVYKPGTNTPATFKKNKPYTVVYNLSGNCFFLKASAEGNTIAAHVLAGDTFSTFDDVGITGTLDLSQLVSGNLRNGVTISNGDANITGKSTIVDTADAVLDPAYLVQGYSGYDDGVKKNGQLPNFGASQVAVDTWADGGGTLVLRVPSTGAFTSVVNGYKPELSKYDSNFVAKNILNGVPIFGLTGSLVPRYFASGTIPNTSIGKNASYTIPLGFTATCFGMYNNNPDAINNSEGLYYWSAYLGWLVEYFHYATRPYPAMDTSNNSIRLYTEPVGTAISLSGPWYAWG